ncbi:MAG: TRAP transporter small permease [Methylococcales bacterium]|nr:TRAP transporter small permease [Methylococcales bacterium]
MQSPHWIVKTHQFLLKIEVAITVGLLLSMIMIATLQIIMRNFWGVGILWGESYVRIAVLWLAFFGATLACRHHRHLAIDVLINKLTPSIQRWVNRFNDLFSGLICFVVSYHSSLLIYSDYQDGGIAFASVPNWLCEIIIPFAFALMGSRYLLTSCFDLRPKI